MCLDTVVKEYVCKCMNRFIAVCGVMACTQKVLESQALSVCSWPYILPCLFSTGSWHATVLEFAELEMCVSAQLTSSMPAHHVVTSLRAGDAREL